MRMSLDFREICFFSARRGTNYPSLCIRSSAKNSYRCNQAGWCDRRRTYNKKRPRITNQTDRRPGRCLHFGGSGEAIWGKCRCMHLDENWLSFQPQDFSARPLLRKNIEQQAT